MKLARPDIFHPRIVLAGGQPPAGGDDEGLVGALRGRGLHAHWLAWDDPQALRADLVILRAAPDRARLQDFLAWAHRVPNLLNPPDAIAWNAEPRYLLDLQHDGVPTLAGPEPEPTTALVFFGGGRSHAFGAAGADPDFELWDLGRFALRVAAERLSIRIDELLYARADVVGGPADARLAGLDLVAPQLGWRQLTGAERDVAQRGFVLAVESALERLGLGPLSHRRP